MSTPSFTPFTANLVFTYPSAPLDSLASGTSHATSSSSSSHHANPQHSLNLAAQHCGIAHRRSSSSGDQSDHSLHSPTIISLWLTTLVSWLNIRLQYLLGNRVQQHITHMKSISMITMMSILLLI
jgi:hypothetical protein